MPLSVHLDLERQQLAEEFYLDAGHRVERPNIQRMEALIPVHMPELQHPVILTPGEPTLDPPELARYYAEEASDGWHRISYYPSATLHERETAHIARYPQLPDYVRPGANLTASLWHELTHAVQAERMGMDSDRLMKWAAAQWQRASRRVNLADMLFGGGSYYPAYASQPYEDEAFRRSFELANQTITTEIRRNR